jgi:hypothetical protein
MICGGQPAKPARVAATTIAVVPAVNHNQIEIVFEPVAPIRFTLPPLLDLPQQHVAME